MANRVDVIIVSGEGEIGSIGSMTATTGRGVRARLTRERCGGDRWAFARLPGGERLRDDEIDAAIRTSVSAPPSHVCSDHAVWTHAAGNCTVCGARLPLSAAPESVRP
jgi:hypothetical protein